MRMERWRAWCEKNGAIAMATPEKEKNRNSRSASRSGWSSA
jgi:hypothetical protein